MSAPRALAAGQIDATTMSIGVWMSIPDKTGFHILIDQGPYYAAAPTALSSRSPMPRPCAGASAATVRRGCSCKGQWSIAVPAAIASVASYLLILWVWGHAPIAPAAALRDTSAVFAILIAVVWLKEPFTRTRIVAVLLAAAAIPLLRLG